MSVLEMRIMVEDFKTNFSNKESLYHTNRNKFKEDFAVKHSVSNTKCPAITSLLFSSKFNSESFDRLEFMLNMAEKVENKDIVEHDASVVVGQRLVDDIVKPQLEKNK